MKTLIELFDERPIENVIGTEMFRPERTLYLCPGNIAENRTLHRKLREYFQHRGIRTECIFVESSMMNAESVAEQLIKIIETYPDCVLDITGGTESALYAAGLVGARTDVPVITYSRKRRMFFNIQNAPFAQKLPCDVSIDVEDSIRMAGGSLREGRVDNRILENYAETFEPFFRVFLDHKREWTNLVSYFQRASQAFGTEEPPLHLEARPLIYREKGKIYRANAEIMERLVKIGYLKDFHLDEEKYAVSFTFRDANTRKWLRDVGSVLELYVYKKMLDCGKYGDVMTSAVVDWEGNNDKSDVTNEIDVMGTCGVSAYFISCKTCDVKTEALNELAILRDRFGGNMAKAAIVTAEPGGVPMRKRAAELGITVIDGIDLRKGRLEHLLKELAL